MSLHARQPSAALVSDYESDAATLAQQPMPEHYATRTNDELNLAVLQRYDPSIHSIEHVAHYVVTYRYATEPQAGWDKSGVEGTAFIVRLLPTEQQLHRFAVVILNRRGLDNFRREVDAGASVEVMEDIIMFQARPEDSTEIFGFWVYSEPPPSSTAGHREAFARKLQECIDRASR